MYSPLRADLRGRKHLLLGLGAGQDALLRVIGELQTAPAAPAALLETRVLFVPEGAASTDVFRTLGLAAVQSFADADSLLSRFRNVLNESLMGTRLYIAGPEHFIGRALTIALEFNLSKDEIGAEEQGTLARRVYCVHCRVTNEAVRNNLVCCYGCARWLFVRDHYSRHLAAYMGVMVDAEKPGERPPLQEIYP